MIDVVILAGGQSKGLQEEAYLPKSLLLVRNRYLLDYVLDALQACTAIDRIAVVGPRDLAERIKHETALFVQSDAGIFQNLLQGVHVLGRADWVLVVTADLPFLTGEALTDFLHRCQAMDADLYYPIIEKQALLQRFPDMKRTYIQLREGSFTGGNLLLFSSDILQKMMPFAERVLALRKKPLYLAGLLGYGFLWRMFWGRLALQDVERRVWELSGIRGKSVLTPYVEIGADLDKKTDLNLVQAQ